FQTLLCCFKKFGRAPRSDLVAGKYTIKMRDVTVLAFRSFEIPVVYPFPQLTRFADLHWLQTGFHLLQFVTELFVDTEIVRGPDTVPEQIANDLHVHCWASADRNATRMFVLG